MAVDDQAAEKKEEEKVKQHYEVGEFVAAVYEGQWLLALVDIDQDKAGKTHVNLNYMKKVGRNQFKWPKYQDLLLTQREDILTKCSAPIDSSFRACSVGLWPSDAAKADAALELVVYLQPFLNIFLFFFIPNSDMCFYIRSTTGTVALIELSVALSFAQFAQEKA
jgi:hypothetical protein